LITDERRLIMNDWLYPTDNAGAEWLRSCKVELSDFGVQVAGLLDELFAGIYHEQAAVRNKKVNWMDTHYISICIYGQLSTFDFDKLTRLVVLCHDHCIRCEVEGAAPKYLRLNFTHRVGRVGSGYEQHPTIEDAIARMRSKKVA
jgi:hypothetical protein